MEAILTRGDALSLLTKYNREPFHLRHAFTVEAVMRWYAEQLGYGAEADFWAEVGLLHDIDFELYPDEHCTKAPVLLREGGVGEDMIRAVCSHGYGICLNELNLLILLLIFLSKNPDIHLKKYVPDHLMRIQ